LHGKTWKAVKFRMVHKSPQESADFEGEKLLRESGKRTPTKFDKESRTGACARKTRKDVKFRIFRNVPQSSVNSREKAVAGSGGNEQQSRTRPENESPVKPDKVRRKRGHFVSPRHNK
jgi:hypothetical protein